MENYKSNLLINSCGMKTKEQERERARNDELAGQMTLQSQQF